MAGIRAFDARALTMPDDAAAAHAFTERLRTDEQLPRTNAVALVAFILAFVTLGGVAAVIVALLVVFAVALGPGAIILGILFLVPLLLAAGALVAAVVFSRRAQRAQELRRWRLAGFARDVGMEFVPAVRSPALPGVIFAIGGDRQASDVLRGREPRFVEVGNHSYTVSNGKNTSTVRWGYIAIRLAVPLPHIVLDATANDGLFGTNLPASWGRAQRLSLEGDFDRHFRLFCPQGYERDALYLFTPDVMARLIDTASVLDVEIVDDWLLLYSGEELSTVDPARWAWVFSVISTLLDKLAQWERWRDDRLAQPPASPALSSVAAGPAAAAGSPAVAAPLVWERPPVGVAPPGRRLRGANPWVVAGVVLGVVGLGGLLVTFGPLFLFLFAR